MPSYSNFYIGHHKNTGQNGDTGQISYCLGGPIPDMSMGPPRVFYLLYYALNSLKVSSKRALLRLYL